MPHEENADDLLRQVHTRIHGGVDITTFSEGGDGAVEISWRSEADGILSYERTVSGPTLAKALRALLVYEDEIAAREADEEDELAYRSL
jgi:hypothetical protein